MKGSFHGRTLGSLAVTYNKKYRAPYAAALPDAIFVPFDDTDKLARLLASDRDIAAVIVEPIQWSSMQVGTPAYFKSVRQICDAHDVALILDEVQTGVGRTGTFSMSESLGIRPDMVTMAKSLGSGIPASAVLMSQEVADSVKPGDQGTTFGGGMVAMAAVVATLNQLSDGTLMKRVTEVFDYVSRELSSEDVEVRGMGCLIGLDLHRPAAPVIAALRERAVLTGGTTDPNVVRIMPPYIVTDENLATFASAFGESVRRSTRDAWLK